MTSSSRLEDRQRRIEREGGSRNRSTECIANSPAATPAVVVGTEEEPAGSRCYD